jgi:MFS family permease
LTGNNRRREQRFALALLCVAQFVVVLDATIVATALPAIGRDLRLPDGSQAWVITAYTVVLAGLLILGGRAADLVGARSMFVVGTLVFSMASAGCALAWSPAGLVLARRAQGVGAALLSPAALAALASVVRGQGARGRALGWWTAAGAGGGASGWVLGGLVTEFAGWRWIFAVNLRIGVLALVLARVLLIPAAAVPTRERRTHLDLPGAVSRTAAIA